ncbi:MAG TPA: EAL domain-containing protein [Acidimicrobiia bacterium]|nr:EAL domain-containing protein [Acidimicrobiia bacterium]
MDRRRKPSERKLSAVLREFARTMVTDFPIQGILDQLVGRIVDVLPITGASVRLVWPPGSPRHVAVAGTVDTAAKAVFTFPLRHGDDQLGTLDLYRDRAGPLSAAAREAAQTLADVAAAYVINAQTRTALRASSQRAREVALQDPLTGLPNRVLFLERLDHAARRRSRSKHIAAVLFVDLDRFKLVNDVYGHRAGDELLVAVAERLTTVLRPGDTLARLAGDEFVVLCEDLDTPVRADAIAARIGTALAPPFSVMGVELAVTASVGIAFLTADTQAAEHLLQDADMAMYQAKRQGGARHQIIDLSEKRRTLWEVNLERELRGATGRGELRLDYQPIVATGDGRITGVEALLRWAHPSEGLVPPTMLIPIAERCGLINEIGQWALTRACLDFHPRSGPSLPDNVTVAVNISAHQLMFPGFLGIVADVLSETGSDPQRITFEVTESAFVHDTARALGVLHGLKDLGVRLALDDFGTGYSSLEYLKRFPIDIVKIDRKFVYDLEVDPTSHAIIYTIVELAHVLGMTVVAEGVETAEQHRQLASIGCDFCQGFHFARPMAHDNLEQLIGSALGTGR